MHSFPASRAIDPNPPQRKRAHFGYKMHIGMDAGAGLIRGVEFTPTNVADTEVSDALTMETKRRRYADKAYESKERRERLRARGCEGSDHAPGE